MPEGELGHLSYLLDRHYLIVTLDKSCHLPGLSFFTSLMEDVGQKLDLPAFLIAALRAAALGLAPRAPLGPGPLPRGAASICSGGFLSSVHPCSFVIVQRALLALLAHLSFVSSEMPDAN